MCGKNCWLITTVSYIAAVALQVVVDAKAAKTIPSA
jgi:hypothetical protein